MCNAGSSTIRSSRPSASSTTCSAGSSATADNGSTAARLAPYGVDVREDADHIYVEAELPGFKKDDVDITLENQTLTIAARATRGEGAKAASKQAKRPARASGATRRFLRSFTLPPTVDEQSVNAKLQTAC